MMRIINKIYIWFKKVILNILGVIRDMINKDNEYEVEMMKAKCEMTKYIIEKSADAIKTIFNSRMTRYILGVCFMSTGVGLLASIFIKLPDDEGEIDDEN